MTDALTGFRGKNTTTTLTQEEALVDDVTVLATRSSFGFQQEQATDAISVTQNLNPEIRCARAAEGHGFSQARACMIVARAK
jgi:hypothetical protein